MAITEKESPRGIVIRFDDVLDHTMDYVFRKTVERVYQLNSRHVVFDFTHLRKIDNIGLTSLLMTLFGLISRKTLCSMINPNLRILKGIGDSHMITFIRICSSEEEAWGQW